jgi:hypothetical protein
MIFNNRSPPGISISGPGNEAPGSSEQSTLKRAEGVGRGEGEGEGEMGWGRGGRGVEGGSYRVKKKKGIGRAEGDVSATVE